MDTGSIDDFYHLVLPLPRRFPVQRSIPKHVCLLTTKKVFSADGGGLPYRYTLLLLCWAFFFFGVGSLGAMSVGCKCTFVMTFSGRFCLATV